MGRTDVSSGSRSAIASVSERGSANSNGDKVELLPRRAF
jgi:hypothetical protein